MNPVNADSTTTRAMNTAVFLPPMMDRRTRMLGSDRNLAWHQDDGNVVIDELPNPLPCDYAWAFKIEVGDATDGARRGADEKSCR